jgi:hypothetical protein
MRFLVAELEAWGVQAIRTLATDGSEIGGQELRSAKKLVRKHPQSGSLSSPQGVEQG